MKRIIDGYTASFFLNINLNIKFISSDEPKNKNIRRVVIRKGEEKRVKRMSILENSWEPIFIDVVNKSSGYYGVIKIVS